MPGVSFLFAGQGSQIPGMGKDLYLNNKAARDIFDSAGDDIKSLCFEAEAADINITVNAQPCLFTVCLAVAAAVTEMGFTANSAAGFSLGEVPAAVYCGLFDFQTGLSYVKKRAKAMHECALRNPGRMYAVLRLSANETASICSGIEECYTANINCPGQTVVSCSEASAEALESSVKNAGGKAIRLATSGPFHSPMMSKASEDLAEYLGNIEFGEMRVPLYSNVTAKPFTADIDRLMAKQITAPVLWQSTIENMAADGSSTFIEVGPGKTLAGLVRKITDIPVYSVFDIQTLNETVDSLRR